MKTITLYEILGIAQYVHKRSMSYELCGKSVDDHWGSFPEALLGLIKEVVTDRDAFRLLCERVRRWNGWENDEEVQLSYHFDRENNTVEVTAVGGRGERTVVIDLTRGGEILDCDCDVDGAYKDGYNAALSDLGDTETERFK